MTLSPDLSAALETFSAAALFAVGELSGEFDVFLKSEDGAVVEIVAYPLNGFEGAGRLVTVYSDGSFEFGARSFEDAEKLCSALARSF